jgi:hypothetical protein
MLKKRITVDTRSKLNLSKSSTNHTSEGKDSSKSKRKEYLFLEEFDFANDDDFYDLFTAIKRDNESIATHEFFYPMDKDFEFDHHLPGNQKLSSRLSEEDAQLASLLKHQLFKSKLGKENFVAYKIKANTHYSFTFSLGYIETWIDEENP